MGNSDLRTVSDITEESLENLEGTTLAVDAHNWLYKYLTITVQYTDSEEYTTTDGVELPTAFGVIQGGKRFFEYSITPIFVFDGSFHNLKQDEVDRRAEKKKEAKEKQQQTDDLIESAKYESRSVRLTPEMISHTKELFDHLGFQYLTAPQSGESQAAYMALSEESIDGIISDDYDSILFKSPQTYRNFTQPKNLERIDFQRTLNTNDLTHTQLVNMAILCGTDYNEGLQGYGPKTSITAVKENTLQEIMNSEGLDSERRQKLEQVQNIFLNPSVTSEYSYNTDLPVPNTEAVRENLITRGISLDSLDTSLNTIKEEGTQSGLSEWN